MARAVVELIDGDPRRDGLQHARVTCERWQRTHGPDRNIDEWAAILIRPWAEIREIFLDESEEARRLRQNSPFAGVLPPRKRWEIYRRFRDDLVYVREVLRHGLASMEEVRGGIDRLPESERALARTRLGWCGPSGVS